MIPNTRTVEILKLIKSTPKLHNRTSLCKALLIDKHSNIDKHLSYLASYDFITIQKMPILSGFVYLFKATGKELL